MAEHASAESSAQRRSFYESLVQQQLGPLWEIYANTLTSAPTPRDVAYRWQWKDLRPLLYEAARLVGPEEAERRVLMLLNPGLPALSAITQTLYAGMQIILPGEVARSHRHSPNALRFVVEGTGAFTAVNGERTIMHPGDFVTTPTWVWHDHGNEADSPVVWLDGLDMPFVTAVSAMFYQKYSEPQQPLTRPVGDSLARYGRGFRPAFESKEPSYSPIISYPYAAARSALETIADTEPGSPYDGVLMQYLNPLTGGSVLPTMDAFLQWISPGRVLKAHRHTGATIYLGVQGHGVIEIDGQRYPWEPHDVIVVPSWSLHRHQNTGQEPAILFSFSDLPIIRAFSLYREESISE